VAEQRCRTVPPAADGAERDRDDEQAGQHARVDDLVDPHPADSVDEHRRDSDPEHRQRGSGERQHERGRRRDRDQPDAEPRRRSFVDMCRRQTELAAEHADENDDGDDDGDDRSRPHPREERGARRVLSVQRDQVRQVRPRQEQRRRVRHEHRSVQERRLVCAAHPCEVQEHRRQEDDRGVKVKDRGHHRDEREREQVRDASSARRARERRAGRGEQAVLLRDHADEEQPGDQNERRPHLAGRPRDAGHRGRVIQPGRTARRYAPASR